MKDGNVFNSEHPCSLHIKQLHLIKKNTESSESEPSTLNAKQPIIKVPKILRKYYKVNILQP